jgi:multidrug resistance efflux pump
VDFARKATRRRGKAVIGVAAALIGLVGITGTVWRSSASAAPAIERKSIWTERVRRGSLVIEVPVQGTLVPEHVQWLSAVSAARVARIAVRPGAEVLADTVVVILENAELELAALESERQAASAEASLIQLDVKTLAEEKTEESSLSGRMAELGDAERQAAAAEKLAPQGLMSDLDARRAHGKVESLTRQTEAEASRKRVLTDGRGRQLTAQRAEVDRLREIAKVRRRQLAALEVRAGIRGIVQDVPLENGQWVAAGTLLAKVAEPDRLKADVRVAQASARDVRKGLGVRFEAPSGNFRGRIERVDPAVVNGSVRLEVALSAPLPPGARVDEAVTGQVEIDKLDDVLFTARPAGAQDGALAEIFRLDEGGGHASRVTARLGRGSGREVEILGGLGEGDEIVVSDTSSWETRDRVRLK